MGNAWRRFLHRFIFLFSFPFRFAMSINDSVLILFRHSTIYFVYHKKALHIVIRFSFCSLICRTNHAEAVKNDDSSLFKSCKHADTQQQQITTPIRHKENKNIHERTFRIKEWIIKHQNDIRSHFSGKSNSN